MSIQSHSRVFRADSSGLFLFLCLLLRETIPIFQGLTLKNSGFQYLVTPIHQYLKFFNYSLVDLKEFAAHHSELVSRLSDWLSHPVILDSAHRVRAREAVSLLRGFALSSPGFVYLIHFSGTTCDDKVSQVHAQLSSLPSTSSDDVGKVDASLFKSGDEVVVLGDEVLVAPSAMACPDLSSPALKAELLLSSSNTTATDPGESSSSTADGTEWPFCFQGLTIPELGIKFKK